MQLRQYISEFQVTNQPYPQGLVKHVLCPQNICLTAANTVTAVD